MQRSKKQILNLEIKVTHNVIKQLEKDQQSSIQIVKTVLNKQDYDTFNKKQRIHYKKHFNNNKHNNINKLEKLTTKSRKNNINIDKKWLKNYTNTHIPQEVEDMFALGPKFCVETKLGKDINIAKMLTDVEYTINLCKPGEKRHL